MDSDRSGMGLPIGLAACGLALVAAGVWLSRRRKVPVAAASPADDAAVETGGGDSEPALGEEAVDYRQPNASQENLLLLYLALLFVLSIPFWVIGGRKLPLPMNLPASALMFVNPVIAASILTYRQLGLVDVKALLRRAFDYKRVANPIWYVPILFLDPLIKYLSYVIMRLTGAPLPEPNVPLILVPVFLVGFFLPALCEELGWTGFALDPLQRRWGALTAGILLGLVWAIWHAIPYVQTGNSVSWIVWHSLNTVALRVLIVWLYNNTGRSVFASILYHDVVNVSWSLFPNYGSHYNPFITSMLTCLTAVLVVIGWGPRTLARLRTA